MKKLIALFAILSLTSFKYEEPVKLKFEFTQAETNLILDALGELPAKKVYPLIDKILIESKKQMTAK
jgi:hypothetical protein